MYARKSMSLILKISLNRNEQLYMNLLNVFFYPKMFGRHYISINIKLYVCNTYMYLYRYMYTLIYNNTLICNNTLIYLNMYKRYLI